MKKMITFLTIALTTLVAFVSCANPTYSDEMIELGKKFVFDNSTFGFGSKGCCCTQYV